MKPRIRIDRAVLIGVLAAALLLGTGVPAAYALLDDTPIPLGSSATNPSAGVDAWWRMGWGNTAKPEVKLALPPVADPEFLLGMLYMIDRTRGTSINTSLPGQYYLSANPVGTNLDQTLDLQGTLAYGTWPMEPGAVLPIEGTWYFHYKFFSNLAYSTTLHEIPLGVDVTPPGAVAGLQASPSLGVAGDPDRWFGSSRAHVSWTPAAYDALSGDGYYQVLIDDQPMIPEDGSTSQGRVYAIPSLPTPGSITIENMPAGRHKVSVVVVDRATNEGPAASTYFKSDPDTPTISVSVPPVSGGYAQVTALVRDEGGIASVDFSVDSSWVAQVTSPPYTVSVPVGTGTHSFTATVTDMLGRTATASADVSADPSDGFRTFITAAINGFTYPDASGSSPVRYFSASSIAVSFTASRTVDAFAYTLSRSADSSPSLSPVSGEPPTAFMPLSSVGGESGTSIAAGTLDLASWNAVQASPPSSIEGTWFLTVRAAISDGYPPLSSTLRKVQFVIDVTPPAAPTGLVASDGLPTSTWTGSARRNLQWNNYPAGLSQYDALSGDDYYIITVNGVERARSRPFLSLPFNYFSVEDLQAGSNIIGVSVVDKAGNRGPETALTLLADPDIPRILNTSPDRVGRFAALSCVASDNAGISAVNYTVDGTDVGTVRTAPYGLTVDVARFGLGPHTVVATAYDMAGRTASSSKVVTVMTLTAPSIYGVSDSPDPFFPIKRDRYKDDAVIHFHLSRRSVVSLNIYDASGVLVRQINAWKNPGANSIKWNGRMSNNAISTGTYTYELVADDQAYGVSRTGRYVTHLKSYILVRLRRNKVRVVFH